MPHVSPWVAPDDLLGRWYTLGNGLVQIVGVDPAAGTITLCWGVEDALGQPTRAAVSSTVSMGWWNEAARVGLIGVA